MEAIKKILQKIEQPLQFASQNNFKNLSHIKDLGKSLLNLLELLKRTLPPAPGNESAQFADELLNIFFDYDWQKLELKKTKIEKALWLLDKLKSVIDTLPEIGRASCRERV